MTPRDGWDTRVIWNEQRQQWWWNAWRESTSTEFSGFADSREAAQYALASAVDRHCRGLMVRMVRRDIMRPASETHVSRGTSGG
jgi:hypothetical protein